MFSRADEMQETMDEGLERSSVSVWASVEESILAPAGTGTLQRIEEVQPALRAGFVGLVEAELEIHVDQTRSMDGALQVAAHPVETVGNSGKHGVFS